MQGDSTTVHGSADLSAVRRTVTDAAADALDPERAGDVELAVSELVTNALEHGAGDPVVVRHHGDGDAFLVTVSSTCDSPDERALPVPGPVPRRRPDGRGLRIVERLADAVERRRRGRLLEIRCRFRRSPTPG